MAGDWIKIKSDIAHDSRIIFLSSALNISKAEFLFALLKLAYWFQEYGKNGCLAEFVDSDLIDTYVEIKGFSSQLEQEGWIQFTEHGAVAVGFMAPFSERKPLTKKIRDQVLKDAKCKACGTDEDLQVDHIVPVSKGGSDELSNLQPLCKSCNSAKGAKSMEEFINGVTN